MRSRGLRTLAFDLAQGNPLFSLRSLLGAISPPSGGGRTRDRKIGKKLYSLRDAVREMPVTPYGERPGWPGRGCKNFLQRLQRSLTNFARQSFRRGRCPPHFRLSL